MRYPFIAGNWKMHKTIKEAADFAEKFRELYDSSVTDVKVAICAPFTQLAALKEAFEGTGILVGAQNVHFEDKGAFTGEISADMLCEAGVDCCIVGHSERREYFGETNETVNLKLHKLFEKNIMPIMCVGEGLEQREAGEQNSIVRTQLVEGLVNIAPEDASRLVIAYEPIWAIGTGRTASPSQAQDMCAYIRQVIEEIYDETVADKTVIQYGGSVKPSNAAEIMNMEDIDGALVGGASLNPDDFIEIVNF